jgi:hypothetical protein
MACCGLLHAVADILREVRSAMFDQYRPERHYMRGPGPQFHAKQSGTPAALPAR